MVVGEKLDADDLIRCQAYIGGRELRLRGENLVKPASVEAPDLDSSKPLDCTVIIDLDQHRVTFKVSEYSVSGELKNSIDEIRWYGYVVENTKTTFGKIEVKQAK